MNFKSMQRDMDLDKATNSTNFNNNCDEKEISQEYFNFNENLPFNKFSKVLNHRERGMQMQKMNFKKLNYSSDIKKLNKQTNQNNFMNQRDNKFFQKIQKMRHSNELNQRNLVLIY